MIVEGSSNAVENLRNLSGFPESRHSAQSRLRKNAASILKFSALFSAIQNPPIRRRAIALPEFSTIHANHYHYHKKERPVFQMEPATEQTAENAPPPVPRCRGKIMKPCDDCRADFFGLGTTRFCAECRYKPGNRKPAGRKRYVPTPEIDRVIRDEFAPHTRDGRTKRLAAQLGWSVDAVQKRATELGLTVRPRVAWGEKDTALLEKWAGQRSPAWIAENLRKRGFPGRTRSAVVQKINKLGHLSAVKEGYSGNELMVCFGVTEPTVSAWIRKGMLKARASEHLRGRRHPWVIEEEAIVDFILKNPTAFRLRDVDQTWFLDLIDAYMCRKAVPGKT